MIYRGVVEIFETEETLSSLNLSCKVVSAIVTISFDSILWNGIWSYQHTLFALLPTVMYGARSSFISTAQLPTHHHLHLLGTAIQSIDEVLEFF